MASPLLKLAAAAARWLPAPVKRALYRLGPASRGLRAALNRSAPTGLSQVQVAGGGLAGAQLLLDLHREKDYWLGTYEMELQQAIADWARLGMIAYDLGANIGYISLLLARAVAPTGQVFSFEALPGNQDRLIKNLSLNPGMKVELISKAVTDKKGGAIFLVHASEGMGKLQGSLGRKEQYEQTIRTEGIPLDEFVYAEKHPPPDLIKIDIEGGEVLALHGMHRVLQEARPLILIELHGRETTEIAWEILSNAGYKLSHMRKGYPGIADMKTLGKKNYVLARPN